MSKTHLIYALIFAVVLAVFAGCTSSTSSVRTNPGYDGDYTSSTRSRPASSAAGDTQFPQEVYHPPITLSMVAMDTGEVLKGEAYPVVAIVDNPEKRELKYKWSVEAGVLAALPESQRSEVTTWEQKLREAKGLPGAPKPEETAQTPADGNTAGASSSAAGPQALVSPMTPPAAPGGQQPPSLPTPEKPAPADQAKPASTPTAPADTTKPLEPVKPGGVQVSMASMKYALLPPEEDTDAQTWPEPVEKTAEEAAPADTATDPAAGEETAPAEDAAEPGKDAAEVDGKINEVTEDAGEMEGFKPEATEGKLVEVPAEPEEGEDGEDMLAEEPPLVTAETDLPYILWTPAELGSYTITCVVVDKKGNELTPVRSFPVTVTEPTPKSEIVWNTTEKLNEEDYLVAEVRLKNITNYSKGLFTVSYDPTKLSFRTVETGAFFPAEAKKSLYFAQPPGETGKVTMAISVDQLDLPQGDGVAARVIFKVKEDIADPASLDIAQVTSEEARYVLDAEGKNILPAVPDKPIYATEWTEPPAAPTQERSSTSTGSQLPTTPEPPGGASSKRDQLVPSTPGAAPGAATPLAPGSSSQQTAAPASSTLQVLEARKRSIMEDQSLTEEQRQQQIQSIDEQIRALIGAAK